MIGKNRENPFYSIRHYLPVIILPLILFSEPLIKGEALFWGLPATQFVPWRDLAWQLFASGHWPLWNPLNGMGAPLLANYQLAFFYPPGWLLYLFQIVGDRPWMAWSFLLINALHLSWAGIGMMCFLRKLGASPLGQIVSGLAFGMCGFFIARIGTASMIWTGAWLPWSMLGGIALSEWVTSSQTKPYPFYLIAVIAMQLLSGHAQLAWYSMILLAGWVAFLVLRQKKAAYLLKGIFGAALALILALGLTAIQLLPTAEYLMQSQRAESVELELGLTYSFWPWRLFTFISPDIFGNPANATFFGYASFWEDAVYLGLIPFLLVCISIYILFKETRKKNNKDLNWINTGLFFWIVVLVGVLFALGKNTPIFPFLFKYIPSFDLFHAPTRYMIWVEFSLAALAGLTIDRWVSFCLSSKKALKRFAFGSLVVAMSALSVRLIIGDIRLSFVSAITLTGFLAFIFFMLCQRIPAEEGKRLIWEWAVIGIICMDLVVAWWGLTPTIDMGFYDRHIESIPTEEQGSRLYIPAAEEYQLKFNRFFRFNDYNQIEDWKNLRSAMLPNLNILEGIPSANNFDPLVPARYAHVMNELDLVDTSDIDTWLGWMNVSKVETRDSTAVNGIKFQDVEAWGRFRWSSCAELASNEEDAWELTMRKMRIANSFQSIVIETDRIADSVCPSDQNMEILVEEIKPMVMKLSINAPRPGFVEIADVHFPGWIVKVDGINVDVFHADYLFYAFQISEGDHVIEITYEPASFSTGLVITGFSFVFVILLVTIYKLKKRSKY